jgi:hypothetical protein
MLPRTGRRLLEKAERNELFEIGIKDSDALTNKINSMVNRLSLSIVIAGLTVSLAILISVTSSGSPIRSLVLAGFIAIICLGVWLLISILRGRT